MSTVALPELVATDGVAWAPVRVESITSAERRGQRTRTFSAT
jgi:hypothetical protein